MKHRMKLMSRSGGLLVLTLLATGTTLNIQSFIGTIMSLNIVPSGPHN